MKEAIKELLKLFIGGLIIIFICGFAEGLLGLSRTSSFAWGMFSYGVFFASVTGKKGEPK